MKNIYILQIVLGILFNMAVLHSQNSAPPPRINFQGTLKVANGEAIPDGNHEIRFDLYSQETNGTSKWYETSVVDVKGGIYSHYLGSDTPLSGSLFDSTLFLAITLNDLELSPRTELTYAPYTFTANTAQFAQEVICSGAVGDVKFSMLAPVKFAELNGDCWIPMDGRNVIDSELYSVNSKSAIPDASGLFFRAQELENGADRDPDRTFSSPLGVVQEDQMLAHSHTFETYTGTQKNGKEQYSNRASDKNLEGSHRHSFERDSGESDQEDEPAARADNDNCPTCPDQATSTAGNHQHRVAGTTNMSEGGDEVRPVNMNLYVYIRIN